jgi:hypothetical protein
MCHSFCNSCKKHQEPPEINLCVKNNQNKFVELERENNALNTIQAVLRAHIFRKKLIASEKVETLLGEYDMKFTPNKESITSSALMERAANESQNASSIPNSDTKQSKGNHALKFTAQKTNENNIEYIEQMIQPDGAMFTGSKYH